MKLLWGVPITFPKIPLGAMGVIIEDASVVLRVGCLLL